MVIENRTLFEAHDCTFLRIKLLLYVQGPIMGEFPIIAIVRPAT